MIASIVLGLTLIIAATFGGALLVRFPVRVAVISLAVTNGLDATTWPDNFGSGGDSSVSVYLPDITCFVVLAAGVVVAYQKKMLPPRALSWPLFILLALVILNFVRGLGESGIKPAGNGVRNLAYFIAPCISLLMIRPAMVLPAQRVAKWFVWFGCGLALLSAVRWIGFLPTPQDLVENSFDYREVVRVLPAPLAMIVGQALIAILFVQIRKGFRWWGAILAALFGVMTIALQHRSVWTSVLVGLAWLAIRTFRRAPKPWLQLAGGAILALCLTLPILETTGRVDTITSLVTNNLDEATQKDSTWHWRLQGYADATERLFSGDPFSILVGPPSGRDLGASARAASVFIHSAYVSTLAYFGVLGFATLLVWLVLLAKKVGGWVRPSGEGSEGLDAQAFLQALLLSQLVYFIAYFGDLLQGAVLACILLASDCRAAPVSMSRDIRTSARPRWRWRVPAAQ